MKTISGFYKTRIMSIMSKTNIAMSTHQIWACFKKFYRAELRSMSGKTKMASVQSAVSRLTVEKHLVRMDISIKHKNGKQPLYCLNDQVEHPFKNILGTVPANRVQPSTKCAYRTISLNSKVEAKENIEHSHAADILCAIKFSAGTFDHTLAAYSWAT